MDPESTILPSTFGVENHQRSVETPQGINVVDWIKAQGLEPEKVTLTFQPELEINDEGIEKTVVYQDEDRFLVKIKWEIKPKDGAGETLYFEENYQAHLDGEKDFRRMTALKVMIHVAAVKSLFSNDQKESTHKVSQLAYREFRVLNFPTDPKAEILQNENFPSKIQVSFVDKEQSQRVEDVTKAALEIEVSHIEGLYSLKKTVNELATEILPKFGFITSSFDKAQEKAEAEAYFKRFDSLKPDQIVTGYKKVAAFGEIDLLIEFAKKIVTRLGQLELNQIKEILNTTPNPFLGEPRSEKYYGRFKEQLEDEVLKRTPFIEEELPPSLPEKPEVRSRASTYLGGDAWDPDTNLKGLDFIAKPIEGASNNRVGRAFSVLTDDRISDTEEILPLKDVHSIRNLMVPLGQWKEIILDYASRPVIHTKAFYDNFLKPIVLRADGTPSQMFELGEHLGKALVALEAHQVPNLRQQIGFILNIAIAKANSGSLEPLLGMLSSVNGSIKRVLQKEIALHQSFHTSIYRETPFRAFEMKVKDWIVDHFGNAVYKNQIPSKKDLENANLLFEILGPKEFPRVFNAAIKLVQKIGPEGKTEALKFLKDVLASPAISSFMDNHVEEGEKLATLLMDNPKSETYSCLYQLISQTHENTRLAILKSAFQKLLNGAKNLTFSEVERRVNAQFLLELEKNPSSKELLRKDKDLSDQINEFKTALQQRTEKRIKDYCNLDSGVLGDLLLKASIGDISEADMQDLTSMYAVASSFEEMTSKPAFFSSIKAFSLTVLSYIDKSPGVGKLASLFALYPTPDNLNHLDTFINNIPSEKIRSLVAFEAFSILMTTSQRNTSNEIAQKNPRFFNDLLNNNWIKELLKSNLTAVKLLGSTISSHVTNKQIPLSVKTDLVKEMMSIYSENPTKEKIKNLDQFILSLPKTPKILTSIAQAERNRIVPRKESFIAMEKLLQKVNNSSSKKEEIEHEVSKYYSTLSDIKNRGKKEELNAAEFTKNLSSACILLIASANPLTLGTLTVFLTTSKLISSFTLAEKQEIHKVVEYLILSLSATSSASKTGEILNLALNFLSSPEMEMDTPSYNSIAFHTFNALVEQGQIEKLLVFLEDKQGQQIFQKYYPELSVDSQRKFIRTLLSDDYMSELNYKKIELINQQILIKKDINGKLQHNEIKEMILSKITSRTTKSYNYWLGELMQRSPWFIEFLNSNDHFSKEVILVLARAPNKENMNFINQLVSIPKFAKYVELATETIMEYCLKGFLESDSLGEQYRFDYLHSAINTWANNEIKNNPQFVRKVAFFFANHPQSFFVPHSENLNILDKLIKNNPSLAKEIGQILLDKAKTDLGIIYHLQRPSTDWWKNLSESNPYFKETLNAYQKHLESLVESAEKDPENQLKNVPFSQILIYFSHKYQKEKVDPKIDAVNKELLSKSNDFTKFFNAIVPEKDDKETYNNYIDHALEILFKVASNQLVKNKADFEDRKEQAYRIWSEKYPELDPVYKEGIRRGFDRLVKLHKNRSFQNFPLSLIPKSSKEGQNVDWNNSVFEGTIRDVWEESQMGTSELMLLRIKKHALAISNKIEREINPSPQKIQVYKMLNSDSLNSARKEVEKLQTEFNSLQSRDAVYKLSRTKKAA
jgi:hypothetical protein